MKTVLSLVALVLGTSVSYAGAPYCGPTYSSGYKSYTPHKAYVAPTYHHQNYKEVHYPVVVAVPVAVDYHKPIAIQGQTLFAYTKVHEAYPDPNLALLADRAGRLVENAQQLQQQSLDGYLQLVTTLRSDKQRQAEILAAAQAITQVLESKSTLEAETTGILRATAAPTDATSVLKASCVKCHEKYGDWESLDYETQFKIFSRVNSSDPEKRMPKAGDGSEEGEPLSDEAKVLLVPVK